MSFTENWLSIESRRALADLARATAPIEGRVLEIGAWEGRSTVALANAAYRKYVDSIDTWSGSPGEPSEALAADRDVFATWEANVLDLTPGNVRAHVGDWRAVLPHLNGPIALAFVDAEHTYTEVRDNLRELLPKMAPGGVICGDDAHHGPVKAAVLEVLGDDVGVIASLWVYQVPARPSLADEYARLCATPSDIYLHLPRFVEMVKNTNAQHVIELGSRSGVSTVAWLYALEQTGGRLTSVDLDQAPSIGDHPHWTHIQGDDEDPQVYGLLEPADIVFLDTSHHYAHTLRELHLYRRFVKPGGLIVCHDTELPIPEGAPPQDAPYPVKRAISEFVAVTGDEWHNFPDCWGLGVIEVS